VQRGESRKTLADEEHLSMEVVPDRTPVKSSRISLESALGAVSMSGPL